MNGFKTRIFSAALASLLMLSGCVGGSGGSDGGSKIEEDKDVAFMIGDVEVTNADFYTGYCCTKNSYEKEQGISDWNAAIDGSTTYHDLLMENCTVSSAFMAWMLSKAGDFDIQIDPEEQARIQEDADRMKGLITKEQREQFGITDEDIELAAEHSAVSNAVFEAYGEKLKEELTDDEKNGCICGEYRFIAVYKKEAGTGDETSSKDDDAETRIRDAQEALKGGMSMKKAIETYSDSRRETGVRAEEKVIIARNGMVRDSGYVLEKRLSEAVNPLEDGSISEIIETVRGYYIFECVKAVSNKETEAAVDILVQNKITAEFSSWMDRSDISYSDLYAETIKNGR
ncbi:MAG: hypothetical protein IJM62_07165 [Lachnospiraceae bacterium]|nr:hypothetical protein [Lachnospiraceae bacterium]